MGRTFRYYHADHGESEHRDRNRFAIGLISVVALIVGLVLTTGQPGHGRGPRPAPAGTPPVAATSPPGASGPGAVVVSNPSRSAGNRARDRARTVLRLGAGGQNLAPSDVSADPDCVTHSYGAVQQYLRQHPCAALYRAVWVIGVDDSPAIVLAVTWVDMPDTAIAEALKKLMDKPGAGNVTELSREHGDYQDVVFGRGAYASTLTGATAINAQAQPLRQGAAYAALAQAAVTAAVVD